MLIAHTGDSHLDERCPHASLEEQVRWLTWIGQDAAKAGAKALVHGGDLFERESTPAERRAAAEVITAWAELMPVVIVRGNHDRPLDLHVLGRLRTRHPVVVQEEPGTVRLPGLDVACLPWPRRAWLAAMMGPVSREALGQAAADGLRSILQGFQVGWRPGVPRVLLAHVELGSAKDDAGQPMAAHCDVPLNDGDLLETGADYVALAHIHRSQTIAQRIRYPGSHRSTAYGQDDDPKGYSLVRLARGDKPEIEHHVSPARPLVTVRALMRDGLLVDLEGIPLIDGGSVGAGDGASCRLVYEVSQSDRQRAAEQADAWRRMMTAAHSVKVEAQVVTVHRVRSEQIKAARTTAERMQAWWSARDQVPARSTQILEKLSTLEAA